MCNEDKLGRSYGGQIPCDILDIIYIWTFLGLHNIHGMFVIIKLTMLPFQHWITAALWKQYIDGILSKGPYPPCLRLAGRALLAGYPRHRKCSRYLCLTGTWNLHTYNYRRLWDVCTWEKNMVAGCVTLLSHGSFAYHALSPREADPSIKKITLNIR